MSDYLSFEQMARKELYWFNFRYRAGIGLCVLLFVGVFYVESKQVAGVIALLWMCSIILCIYLYNMRALKDQELKNKDWNKKWREIKKK